MMNLHVILKRGGGNTHNKQTNNQSKFYGAGNHLGVLENNDVTQDPNRKPTKV